MRCLNDETMLRIISFVDEYYKENSYSPTIAKIAKSLSLATGTVHKYLHRMTEMNKLRFDGRHIITPYISELQEQFHSPIKNNVLTEAPRYHREQYTESIPIPMYSLDGGDYVWYHVNEGSMVSFGIDNGDWILIRKQNTENKCNDVTVSINNETTFASISYNQENHQIILISSDNDNEKHPNQNLDNTSLQGVVVHILKKTR